MKKAVCVIAGLLLLLGILPCKAHSRTGKSVPEVDTQAKFHQALQNTPRRPEPEKTLKAPAIYEPYIAEASRKHNLDPRLIKAVIKQESNYNSQDVSRVGAQGLMQLMPGTAKTLGVGNAFDPYENIHGGAKYLKMQLVNFNGDLSKALAAYNAGPDAVKKYGRVPPYRETRNYVKSVLKYYRQYRGNNLVSYQDANGRLVFTDSPASPH